MVGGPPAVLTPAPVHTGFAVLEAAALSALTTTGAIVVQTMSNCSSVNWPLATGIFVATFGAKLLPRNAVQAVTNAKG